MFTYATIADLYAFQGKVLPDDLDNAEVVRLEALLARASSTVRNLTRLGRFTEQAGKPSAPHIAEAFARATSAQALWWEQSGDPTGFDSAYGFDSASLIGVAFSKRAGGSGDTTPAAARLAPEAIVELAAVNIFTTVVAEG